MEGVFYFDRNDNVFGYVVLNITSNSTSNSTSNLTSNQIHTVYIDTLSDASTALENDVVIVDIDCRKITSIVKRSDLPIPGVFCLSSKVVLDVSTKGVPYKKFKPLCSKYPPFSVPAKNKKLLKDIYGTIKFVDWSKKMPIGQLTRNVGPVGDMVAEKEMIMYRYNLKNQKYKPSDYKDYLDDCSKNRLDITHVECFSIDPPGCRDIDDVLHLTKLDEDKYEVGIHIADVTSYIPEGSPLDKQLQNRIESLYFTDKQINMLPDEMATNICSLIEGESRRAFSVFVVFDKGKIVNTEFAKTVIINKHAISYDDAEAYINSNKYPSLNKLYEIGKMMYAVKNEAFVDTTELYDCHKMVEVFMVLANSSVAKKLVETVNHSALLRKHTGCNTLYNNRNSNVSSKIVNIANVLKLNRAEYVVAGTDIDLSHDGLNESYYTHFTSPIRRYADILVHRLLYNAINKNVFDRDVKFLQIVDRLNVVHNMIQRAQRDDKRLVFVNHLKGKNSVVDTVGTVVGIRGRKIMVYLDEYNFVWDATLFPKELIPIVNLTYDEQSVTILLDKQLIINIFDKLDIRLVVTNKATTVSKKVLLQIIKPNLIDFFTYKT